MIRCVQCTAENPVTGRFCDGCGAALQLVCQGCGVGNRPAARFCGQCGTALASAAASLPAAAVPAIPAAPTPAATPRIDRPGHAATFGEGLRKYATVLFADVRDSLRLIEELDSEDAMQALDPVVQAMADAVARFGGIVNKLQGDGVMALFGAPAATEDHAVRACLAARAMIDEVAALTGPRVAIRVGLASGDVVVRPTGRDPSAWDVIGATVHLAHRLEQLAEPNTASVTREVALRVRGFAEVSALGPVQVKGIAGPVEVFRLLSATARPAWEVRLSAQALTRLVGRRAELAQLSAAASRAGFGRGQAITVVGDAGLGKSRLVHEFLRGLPTGSWHVLRTAAMSHTGNAPYHLAAELVREWIGAAPSDPQAAVARKLRQAALLEGNGIDLAPLQALLDLPVDEPGWAALELPVRRGRVQSALRLALLREAALHPLVLVVEDLHWADPQSVELLGSIADGLHSARLLLVATTRPGGQAGWTGRSYTAELRLAPLDASESDALLAELIGGDDGVAALRRRVVERSEGTPLFLEEIGRSLVESGAVATEPSRTRIRPGISGLPIPDTVQAVLSARIDRLPPVRQRLLRVASVVGKDVPLALLREVAELPPATLRTELDELQAAEFLYELLQPGDVEFTFKHALTQAVAYDGLLRRQRRDLHAGVLRAMERLYPDRLDEVVERLADHALQGEAWDAAARYAMRAGERANARWAWPEAVHHHENALQALSRLPRSPDTIALGIQAHMRLRVALGALGDLTRGIEHLDQGRALAEESASSAELVQIDVMRCLSLGIVGLLDRAIDAGLRALDVATRLDADGPLVTARYALGTAFWFGGELRRAERVLLDGLDRVRADPLRSGGTAGTASVLYLVCLSKTHALLGEFETAEAVAAEASAVAEGTKRPYDLSYARVASGFLHLVRGAPGNAAEVLEAALHTARENGIALLVPSIARYLGRAWGELGRAEEAEALLAEAVAQTERQDLRGLRAWCSLALGAAQAGREPGAAAATLAATLELARRHGFRPVEAQALRLLGGLERDAALAEQHLRAAACLAEAVGMRPEQAAALRDLTARRGGAVEGEATMPTKQGELT